MLLDSDDFFKKNKVKEIVNYFNKYKECNIVFDLPIYYFSKNKKLYLKKRLNVKIKKIFGQALILRVVVYLFEEIFIKNIQNLLMKKIFRC